MEVKLIEERKRFEQVKQVFNMVTIENLVALSYGSSYNKLKGETELMALERQKNGPDYMKIEILIKR